MLLLLEVASEVASWEAWPLTAAHGHAHRHHSGVHGAHGRGQPSRRQAAAHRSGIPDSWLQHLFKIANDHMSMAGSNRTILAGAANSDQLF